MAKIIMTEIRQRGFWGKVVKWLFILFNIIMAICLVLMGQVISESSSPADGVGAAIGATVAVGTLLLFWLIGGGILGILTMVSRGKKIITQETIEE